MKWKTFLIFTIAIFIQACGNNVRKAKLSSSKSGKEITRYCYLKNFENESQKTIVIVDFVEYKKNEEIDQKISPSDIISLPNGFCFVNNEKKTSKLDLSDGANVIVQTFSFDAEGNFSFNQHIKLDEFVRHFSSSEPSPFKFSPYKINIRNNKITSLSEIYIP